MIINESLPEHGAGPLYAIKLGRRWGRGVRLSFGGYGWKLPRYRPHFKRYKGVAHIGIGPVCVTVIWRND